MPQLSLHSPVGDLTVSEETLPDHLGAVPTPHIVAVDWGWGRDQTETPLLLRAREALDAYFDGAPLPEELPLAPAGTPFRQKVWQALRRIPPGQTRTYAELAREVGGSARAIGGAMATNPIPILIPCHRVVAAGGRLGGYSGGEGPATKRVLLDLEAHAPHSSPSSASDGRLPLRPARLRPAQR
jgi:methylated-DNA-[protein]-cysteine S-methyltransferase